MERVNRGFWSIALTNFMDHCPYY